MSLSDLLSVFAALGVGGLIGSVITNWMTERRETVARTSQFRKQQLEQFYGPLLATHKLIRARSELRVRLQGAIEGVAATEKNVQGENEAFRTVLMPLYREMVAVFRDKMWLAEPKTRTFFNDMIEFIDVWDKILADTLTGAAALKIGHTEKNLHPFYRHLEEVHDRLRSEAGAGLMSGETLGRAISS